jgi:hypothetical protein
MVERIRTVIQAEYEVQLPNVGSTTATTTNGGMNSSTTTRMINDCANIDIEYHVVLTLALSSIMT